MNPTENKAIVSRYLDAINRRDLDGAIALVSENLVNHAAIPEAQGAKGLRRIFDKLLIAFPDMEGRSEDMVAEGDRVVCRMSMRGTNTGPVTFLRTPLAATGRRFETEQIFVFRIESGKMVEHWAGRDDIGMLRQLGYLHIGEKQS